MAINRVYAPPLRGLANIAAAAGNADMQLQYDQLRQRDRLARMQLQGQYDQQRIQNQSNMDRMVLGAQLQGQQDAYNRADYQDRFAREMQARQQMDQQNAAQAQALQQGQQAFQVGRDEASLAAQQDRDEMQARNALLMQQEAERQKRQASEEYQKNVVERLNPQGQAQMSAAQKKRADAERVYGQHQISFQTYQDQLREANQMEQSLNDPQYLIPQGSRPGDVIEKDGLYYKTNKDGIQEVDGISNFQEYAKSKGQVIGYLGDEPLYSVTLPSRGGSIRPPVVDPRVEMVDAEKKRYYDELKSVRTMNLERRTGMGNHINKMLAETKETPDPKDPLKTVKVPLYTRAEAEANALLIYGNELPEPVEPLGVTKRPASELAAERDPVGTAAANAAAAGWGGQVGAQAGQFFGAGQNPLAPLVAAPVAPLPAAPAQVSPQAVIAPPPPEQPEGWLPWMARQSAAGVDMALTGGTNMTTRQMGMPGPAESFVSGMMQPAAPAPVPVPKEIDSIFKDRSPEERQRLAQQIPVVNSQEEFEALGLESGQMFIVNGELRKAP